MLEMVKTSVLFKQLNEEYPDLALNIEILFENKLALDLAYHNPKQFILCLNNLLRSFSFLIEYIGKNTPSWLMTFAREFKDTYRREKLILKRLRDVSAHQGLIFPSEALACGVYKILSDTEYSLKIGIGNERKPYELNREIAMQRTEHIFSRLLLFHSFYMMDVHHTTIGEMLGITRRWFYKVDYKDENGKVSEVVDVHRISTQTLNALVKGVCDTYASESGVTNDFRIGAIDSKYNFVNTILEIDLYPGLFKIWWGVQQAEPMNFNAVYLWTKRGEIDRIADSYQEEFSRLAKTPAEFFKRLNNAITMSFDHFIANNDQVVSFIHLMDWHIKQAFPERLSTFKYPVGSLFNIKSTLERLLDILHHSNHIVDNIEVENLWDTITNQLKSLGAELE